MNKFFLYARKSTDEPDRQILSIESQIDELKEFAEREQLEIVETFVESQTAKEPGRPIFNNMLSLIEKGKASGILAWHPLCHFTSVYNFIFVFWATLKKELFVKEQFCFFCV